MPWIEWRGCPAHLLAGRLRVHLAPLRNHPRLAARISNTISQLPGATSAAVNPTTGSLLIHFDPQRLTLAAIGAALEGHLRPRPTMPAAAPDPAVAGAARRVWLTGGALAAVGLKRLLVGPSALSRSWLTYDLTGMVTVVASYPYLRRGVENLLREGRISSDLVLGAVGLVGAIVRENLLSLSALFVTSIHHLMAARLRAEWRARVAEADPSLERGGHDAALAARANRVATSWGACAKGAALLVGLLSGDWRRALATLIAAAPAATMLAVPMPLITAGVAAARRGILVRGPSAMAAAGMMAPTVMSGRQRELAALGRRAILATRRGRQIAFVGHMAGLALAATGAISPVGASVWHNLTSLAVLSNASQLLRDR